MQNFWANWALQLRQSPHDGLLHFKSISKPSHLWSSRPPWWYVCKANCCRDVATNKHVRQIVKEGRQLMLSIIKCTGWPFAVLPTSRWHQNKSSVLEWGPFRKTHPLFLCQREVGNYRVTQHLVPNLPSTSKQKFRFRMRSIYRNSTFIFMSRGGSEQRDGSPCIGVHNCCA